MKKLLVLVLIVFTAITQFLVLNNKIEELKVEVEKLQPTKEEEFIGYLLLQTSNIVFINLGEEYSEDVDAYGLSKTYVYKVEEETTFKIEIIVEEYLLCIARVGNKWVQLKDGQIAHQYLSD